MNNRSVLFDRALTECRRLRASQPYAHESLRIIEEQIEYLAALERGARGDVELLHRIDIGLRTMREVEQGLHEQAAANLLYEVSEVVGRMQFERQLKHGAQPTLQADGPASGGSAA
jgi:hypothetical protein